MAPRKKEILFDFPRPVENRNLVGHGAARRAFLDAWARRDAYPIHPVWLLSGPRGIGKATLAYNLARRIFADATGRTEDEIREQMIAGGIGDMFVADLEHNEKAAKSISVETLRGIIGRMRMSSMAESWRVAVIDSMDELSGGTMNTLLKTLEEPPAKTIFFLIAHSLERALPTIRSRARVEKLRPLAPIELREIIAGLMPGKEVGEDLIKISGGSVGRIAGLIASGADGLFGDLKRAIAGGQMNAADTLVLAKRIVASPENMSVLLDIAAHFRLADAYSEAQADIARMNAVNLEPELTACKIIGDIRRCL
jgi:DNA polymerase-3 subunit delta'